MKANDFDNLRVLCAKERLERESLYSLSQEEKKELERLKKEIDQTDKTIGKTFFYMHYCLGIDYDDIALICNYTYRTVQQRCYEIKDILSD